METVQVQKGDTELAHLEQQVRHEEDGGLWGCRAQHSNNG